MIDCYFRFDDLINSYQINDIDIIFNTNFYYGFGDIYVNLVDNSQDDIIDKFPSKFRCLLISMITSKTSSIFKKFAILDNHILS